MLLKHIEETSCMRFALTDETGNYLHVDFGMCDTVDGFYFNHTLKLYTEEQIQKIYSVVSEFKTNLKKRQYLITTTTNEFI